MNAEEMAMKFEASKLRVQIPCGGSGSIIEAGGGCGDSPQSAFCPTPKPPPPPPPPCGVPSPIGEGPISWDPLVNPAERFVLEIQQLPLLKRELERRLELIKAHLADVERAEQKLKELGHEGPSNG
jgi:hypothetical protein